jgi:MFS family permease
MRIDFKIAILLAVASIPAGVALMAAPEYFAFLKEYPGLFFWGGLILTAVLIGAAIGIALRGEAREPRRGHRRRMVALAGMIVFGIGFLVCAGIYFRPSSWSQTEIPLGSLELQTPIMELYHKQSKNEWLPQCGLSFRILRSI